MVYVNIPYVLENDRIEAYLAQRELAALNISEAAKHMRRLRRYTKSARAASNLATRRMPSRWGTLSIGSVSHIGRRLSPTTSTSFYLKEVTWTILYKTSRTPNG